MSADYEAETKKLKDRYYELQGLLDGFKKEGSAAFRHIAMEGRFVGLIVNRLV